ncbi:uncharacterized protein [Drosophila kikkawai]|uniref:Uncharacterized protein n=1 Tax=Drosophila kikkawai TaxID=30033 RepID=A0A6P4I569_DROKI|nr:uncharacterized protein LOC108072411 [Drosophila kikkawai]KAH8309117.1 hypothetical protein KR059_005912 [Drosophila kikkawai]
MNGARKLKSLRAVRLADVLCDEQKRILMLCRSCERHFMTFEAFQKHLADCSGLRHIVAPTDLLSYDDSKRETKHVNGRQELHIYDIDAVRSSSTFDLEAELEDPRWYTDPKPSLSPPKAKSDLAKENVVEIELQLPKDEPDEEELPAKRPRTLNTLRRPILTAQQQRKTRSTGGQPVTQTPTVKTKTKEPILAPAVMEQLKRMTEAPPKRSPTAASGAERTSRLPSKQTPPSPPKTTPVTPPKTSQSQLPMVSIPMDGTQKILNKLRACGVEVKRGNTLLNVTPPAAESSTKNQEALDIMRKLQSKGIRCTKLTKQ